MNTARVKDVEEAVQLAERWKQSGDHDCFRGQTRNWPVRSSFVRLEDEAAKETALGKMGGFESWVDGEPLMDTLKHGNGDWPPSPSDYVKTVNLQKGSHVLAIRFLSGTGSSVLAVAGPDDLRE